ncbi:MAG: sugar-binding domain-containing protein [Opitutaceae bacterium]|jgi:beta-mannosidase
MNFPLQPRQSLDGPWTLFLSDQPPAATTLAALEAGSAERHPATVPGNFELDLHAAGVIPEPFFGMNVAALRAYETKHVSYARRFELAALPSGPAFLRFEGVDCFATYFLNGAPVGTSDNALVEHEFNVTNHLRFGINDLVVHLRPVGPEAVRFDYPAGVTAQRNAWDGLHVRKAPHSFGWDIMPRALSAGLWRPVTLIVRPVEHLDEVWLRTVRADEHQADLSLHVRARLGPITAADYEVEITGVCRDSRFHQRQKLLFEAGRVAVKLPKPLRWWPRGRGDQNLYDVTVRLFKNGVELDRATFRHGVRTVRLERTATTDAQGSGAFGFHVNGEPVFILGTNHVPADAYHSRDRARIPEIVAQAAALGCNLFRCWGGNVYEDDLFFDLCDEAGILVWQDFALGCALYPQDDDFQRRLASEAVKVVKRLRPHACLALWAGDNEVDEAHSWPGFDGGNPNDNVLNRVVLPAVVRAHDPGRDYLPSSPFIDSAAHGHPDGLDALPERHLWGPRDNFKSDYYRLSPAHFASELGYHGCPAPESVARFISPEKLWPPENDEWLLHSTSPVPGVNLHDYRVELMRKQVRELFGAVPDTLADFAFASQAVQAEALKFFIEHFRSGKWRRTGIVWWNLRDGWPQFSDAIVDYYGVAKRAFAVVRRSQAPLCLVFREPRDWAIELVACNDTRDDLPLTWQVTDVSTGAVVLSGESRALRDAVTPLGRVPFTAAQKTCYHLTWTSPLGSGENHYLAGHTPHSLDRYRDWLRTLGWLGEGAP